MNGTFFMFGDWAWHNWEISQERGGVCWRKTVRYRNKEKNIVGISGTPVLFLSLCPSVLLSYFVGGGVCKDMAVGVGLWWCDGVENKCHKRKLVFVDM